MRIPEATVEAIKDKADLAEVARAFIELKNAGSNTFKACCPFHHEKTPSFHINTAKQVYHCFGCGAGGDVITFVKQMVNTDYIGALEWLAQRYQIPIPEDTGNASADGAARKRFKDDGMRLLEDAATWFQGQLATPAAANARSYLASRGIDEATIARYRIGYAPDSWEAFTDWALRQKYSRALLAATGLAVAKDGDLQRLHDNFRDRIMFTICDELSRPVAFSGRIYNPASTDPRKYVNSPESDFFHKGKVLYGFNFARQTFRETGWALVCEGQLDVIACHRAGLGQALASQGTAFTEEQSRLLKKTGVPAVHLAFDGDGAGQKAAMRTISLLQAQGLQVLITTIPAGEDPDSIFRTGGAHALQQVMSQAEPAIQFALKALRQKHPGGTPEENSAIVHAMLELIGSIPDQVTRIGHIQWLASQMNLPENVLNDLLAAQQRAAREAADRASRFENAARGAQTAPQPSAPQPPAFTIPSLALENRGQDAIAEVLLDLAGHYEPLARQLIDHPLLAELPPTTTARALNLLLALTAEGDWETACRQLLQEGDFVSDSVISRIFTASQFENLAPDPDGNLPPALQQALDDCLARLQNLQLETQNAQLAQRLAQNDFTALQQAAELARQRMRKRGPRPQA